MRPPGGRAGGGSRPKEIKSGAEFATWLLTKLPAHDRDAVSIREIATRLGLDAYHQGVTLPYALKRLHERGEVEKHTEQRRAYWRRADNRGGDGQ